MKVDDPNEVNNEIDAEELKGKTELQINTWTSPIKSNILKHVVQTEKKNSYKS